MNKTFYIYFNFYLTSIVIIITSLSATLSQIFSLSSFFTDSPRSTLTVTPDSPVFTGETVNLKCVIESNHSDWRYEWYKDRVMLQTSVNRDTLTIRGVNESDQGQYWCGGRISSVSSQTSSAVNISVMGELKIVVP